MDMGFTCRRDRWIKQLIKGAILKLGWSEICWLCFSPVSPGSCELFRHEEISRSALLDTINVSVLTTIAKKTTARRAFMRKKLIKAEIIAFIGAHILLGYTVQEIIAKHGVFVRPNIFRNSMTWWLASVLKSLDVFYMWLHPVKRKRQLELEIVWGSFNHSWIANCFTYYQPLQHLSIDKWMHGEK